MHYHLHGGVYLNVVDILKCTQKIHHLPELDFYHFHFSNCCFLLQVNGVSDNQLSELVWKVNKSWSLLRTQANNSVFLETSGLNLGAEDNSNNPVCGVCLLQVNQSAAVFIENSGGNIENGGKTIENGGKTGEKPANFVDINRAVVSYNGGEYHAGCANFWVNCVDLQLPNFNKNLLINQTQRLHNGLDKTFYDITYIFIMQVKVL